MTRTLAEIKAQLTNNYIANTDVIAKYGLVPGQSFEQQFSIVSLENILFSIIAFALFLHEQIVSKNAENSNSYTIPWLIKQCLNFLDGLPLIWKDGQFKYDLTNVVDVDIRKIIDRCAILEGGNGELVIKIAKDNNGNLEPLLTNEFARFRTYISQINPGCKMRYINEQADLLLIDLTVEVDSLEIDLSTGQQLNVSGTVYPVIDAINNYLANLEFNGALVRTFLQDEIQKAVGVKNPIINGLESKYASFPFVPIIDKKIAEAGYFKIDPNDLYITYVAYS